MASVKLEDILPELELLESYLTFRHIEDWCHQNVPRQRWRFDHSYTLCAHGVDIPGRIFFWSEEDATAFKLKYNVNSN